MSERGEGGRLRERAKPKARRARLRALGAAADSAVFRGSYNRAEAAAKPTFIVSSIKMSMRRPRNE